MKPIKIRVWVKSLGLMITPKSINFDDGGNIASVSFADPQVKELSKENSISGMAFCQYTGFRGVNNKEIYDGDIVDLVPAKPKVQVSQEEADMLEKAKHPTLRPSFMITEYSNSHKGNILGNDLEDRLMCAYVNVFTVENEKKYNVKVPLVQAQGGLWFYINSDDKLDAIYIQELAKKFTMDEIEENGLQGCEKVWCDSDD